MYIAAIINPCGTITQMFFSLAAAEAWAFGHDMFVRGVSRVEIVNGSAETVAWY